MGFIFPVSLRVFIFGGNEDEAAASVDEDNMVARSVTILFFVIINELFFEIF